jgi:hypothetical protein
MNERQLRFIKALAEFLVSNEAEMSVRLQMGKNDAEKWSKLRSSTPLFGYYSGADGLDRAERDLINFLQCKG